VEPLGIAAAIVLFTLFGVAAGTGTGLAPGIHVNNVALLLLASRSAFEDAIVGLFPSATDTEIVAILTSFVMGTVIGHGFLDFIPSIYLGAPEEKTALSVLPGHRMLLEGHGHQAARLAALGALVGVVISIPFLLPMRLLLGTPVEGHERLRGGIALILIAIAALLILSEGARRVPSRGRGSRVVSPAGRQRGLALAFFLGSGTLGFALLDTDWLTGWNWFPLGFHSVDFGSLVLFPLFTGLYGFSALALSSRSRTNIPPQDLRDGSGLPRSRVCRGLLSGTVAGACVSWLPGLSSGAATGLAQFLSRGHEDGSENSQREFMVALGAVSTATSVFTVSVLFIIDRARSGAAVAIRELSVGHLAGWESVLEPPFLLLVLVASSMIAATASYPLTLACSKMAARWIHRIRYDILAKIVLAVLGVLLVVMAGAAGLFIAVLAGVLGLGPPLAGVKRVHLMGALVVPVVLLYLGLV